MNRLQKLHLVQGPSFGIRLALATHRDEIGLS